MKFSDGLWASRPGYKLHTPKMLLEYQLTQGSIHAYALCHPIQEPEDYTGGVSLEYTFTAPREDMIQVRIRHFAGGLDRGPRFQLNTCPGAGRAQESESALILRSGRARLELDKEGPFAYRFYYDDRLLTGGGNGQSAYITDSDYEAHRVSDYNRRQMPRPYLDRAWLRERLDLGVGEIIYGLGEHFTPLAKNGQSLDIWNRDGGSNTEQGYKCIPFHLSNRGYGVLVNTPDWVDYEIGTESVRHVQFLVEDETLEYILIGAEQPKDVLSKYTALTGRSPVPPAWSFGLWLSTSWITGYNADQIVQTIDQMAQWGIPLSVFHFDARWMADYHDCDFVWHSRYGDPRDMLRRIHQRGVKVCCWINPYVSQPSRLFQEGLEKGYFLKKPDGSVWQTDVWMTGMAVVDFTNPEASRWYTQRLGEVLDMGVDCIKTDFGERLPTDVVYYDGSDPRKMHNYYPYLYNQAIFGLLKEKFGDQEACVFSRSATVGTQQFPVNWGGDNEASYVSMAESLRGGLSFCQSGFGFWSHDISGFQGTATPDLYKRWCAFGLLSTHSRLHGMTSFRMPWCFDEESCRVLAHFTRLKCSLMPYLYQAAMDVHLQGQPMMRAMMLDFPQEPQCAYLDRQYMLGQHLLVAPIFSPDGQVQFYVPQGLWTDYLTGELFEGGRYYTRTYDYFHLPLLVRPNSIIVRGAGDNGPVYDYTQGAVYQLYQLDKQAQCTVYDAQGQEAVCALARQEEGALVFSLSGRDAGKPWSLFLSHVDGARRVEGGTAQPGPAGLTITPFPGATQVRAEL